MSEYGRNADGGGGTISKRPRPPHAHPHTHSRAHQLSHSYSRQRTHSRSDSHSHGHYSRSRPRNDSRDARDFRDGRDGRDYRDARDVRDYRDGRDGRDFRDVRDYRGGRDFRDRRDGPDGRDFRDGREAHDGCGARHFRDGREARDHLDVRDARYGRGVRESRNARVAQDRQDARDARKGRDSRDGGDAKHRSISSRKSSKRNAKHKNKDGTLTREQAKRVEEFRGEPTYVLASNGRFRENLPGPDIDVLHSTVDIASAVELAIAQLQAGMTNAMNSNLCDNDDVLINREYFEKQTEEEKQRKEKAVKDGEARANVSAHDFYSNLFKRPPSSTPATAGASVGTPATAPAPSRTTALPIPNRNSQNATQQKQNTGAATVPNLNKTLLTTKAAATSKSTAQLNLRPVPTITKPRAGPSISTILNRGPPRSSRNDSSALAALKRISQPAPPGGFKRLSQDPRRLARLGLLTARPNTSTTTNRNTTGKLQLTSRSGGQLKIRITPNLGSTAKSPPSGTKVSVASSLPRNRASQPISMGRKTIANTNAHVRPLAPTMPSMQNKQSLQTMQSRPHPPLTQARNRKELPTTIDLTGDSDSDVSDDDVIVNRAPRPPMRPSNPPPNPPNPFRSRSVDRNARQSASTSTTTQMRRSRKRPSADPVLLAVPIPRKKRKPSGD